MLQAGQSSITLEGGNITFACPGKFTVKGAQHPFEKGIRNSTEFSALPDNTVEFKNFIALNYRDANGDPMAGVGYKIKFEGGIVVQGKLDKDGNTRHENVPLKPIVAEYDERKPSPEQPWQPLAEMIAKAQSMFNR
mgnify:CR=1 FL=1